MHGPAHLVGLGAACPPSKNRIRARGAWIWENARRRFRGAACQQARRRREPASRHRAGTRGEAQPLHRLSRVPQLTGDLEVAAMR